MPAVSFLFNADAKDVPGYYGGLFEPAFLKAVSSCDPEGTIHSVLRLGDIGIHHLCERITSVSSDERRSSHTVNYDVDLYSLIIWDLIDAISEQRHSLDLETIPYVIARNRVYSITVDALSSQLHSGIDAFLKSVNAYLGSFEIDLGNPLQRKVFIEPLINDFLLDRGALVLELSWEGNPESTIAGSEVFLPRGERRVPFGKLRALKPKLAIPDQPSPRGQISYERYKGKKQFSLHERVLEALAHIPGKKGKSEKYSFHALPNAPHQIVDADLPENKFVKYLLNPDHPKGGSKAKFFLDELGIGPEDWRDLAAQFYEGVAKADLTQLEIKSWEGGQGASFNCVISVRGKNGRRANIETNWIVKPGLLPQLSTAYPADRNELTKDVQGKIQIVPSTLVGDAKWAALFDIAHKAGIEAAEAWVATPMKVEGYPVIMDGYCGYAHIHIPDARRDFARWVVRLDKGYKHHKSGAMIFADVEGSQSIEKKLAYAKAFAAVLQFNGVKCTVDSRFD